MTDITLKMPVVLIGNSFKYEVESTLKLFFSISRFAFSDNIEDAVGDNYVVAGKDGVRLYADVMLDGELTHSEKSFADDTQDAVFEHELCRLIFHLLIERTGIIPPWGLMTGIRPVKRVIDLMNRGLTKDEIFAQLTEKYEINRDKLELAYATAVNQQPILEKINTTSLLYKDQDAIDKIEDMKILLKNKFQ